MSIKLILLDLDGTLLNSEKKITPKTKEALIKAQEHGIRLVLASGRPENGLRKIAEELDMYHHNGIFVCYNGAKVVEIETGNVLYKKAMSAELAKKVLNHMKKFDVCPLIDRGEYMYVTDVFNNTIKYKGEDFNVLKYETRNNGFLICEKEDLAEFVDFDVYKILNYASPEYLNENYKDMILPGEELNSMFTSDFYYEFNAKNVDKTQAIRESLLKEGYKPEEMIAFGDAQNDKTMIMFAGIGVAMENATDELKSVADEITLSNNEDGIAVCLYKHMPELKGE